jgi:hypothetical protein
VGAVGFEPTASITVDISPALQAVLTRTLDLVAQKLTASAPPGAEHVHRSAS